MNSRLWLMIYELYLTECCSDSPSADEEEAAKWAFVWERYVECVLMCYIMTQNRLYLLTFFNYSPTHFACIILLTSTFINHNTCTQFPRQQWFAFLLLFVLLRLLPPTLHLEGSFTFCPPPHTLTVWISGPDASDGFSGSMYSSTGIRFLSWVRPHIC